MAWEPIHKNGHGNSGFNLADYDEAVREFSWEQARARLDGLPGGRGLNIAYEAVDRHAAGSRRDKVALRCVAKDGSTTDLTYAQLASQTSRFANLLRSLGVGKGDRVFTLLGRVPELYVAALGTLKNTSVIAPLFSAFGPEPIRERLRLGDAKALVTSPDLYLRKIAPIRDSLPGLEHVLIAGEPPDDTTIGLADALAASSEQFEI
ncbi:MAG TPA: acetate--CoA ligase, partial [Actinobacteria bacterium]|nr:acetate--CoA ligase [Actinomycetota bacterium]